MIKLYDVVRIKDSGITGIVTNISSARGRTVYTVENNKRGRVFFSFWIELVLAL